ncbi:MAG: hypothetical protein Q9M94_04355 [Candidatus Gracilibacteria bacterium]|nr:hypothetical protein [Candidatus Gracilibacteria bacterium]
MKKVIIIIGIFLLIYILDSSYYFYYHYLSCKGISDYECLEKSFNQRGINFKIEVNKDSSTGILYNRLCYGDSCLDLNHLIGGIRKHSIEEKGIKKLFFESF